MAKNAMVHNAIAVPMGAPLNKSSKAPNGNAAATGHRSLRSNLQPSSVMKPSGGRIGMVAIIGSKGASEASMTDMTGISCCSKADGGGAKRSRR